MKILFLFLNGSHFDYIADYTLFGLRKLGHTVVDFPRRRAHYEPRSNVSAIHRQILVGPDPVDRSAELRLSDFDAIIAENPMVLMTNKDQEVLGQIMRLDVPRIALLGNDPLKRGPEPNVRLDYRCRMAIREKCLQSPQVALPYVDDFPLHFVIPRALCRYVDPSERTEQVFFSMGLNTDVRKEYARHFVNQQHDDVESYFSAIRRHRFGISIWGGGILCQRDSELAGNTLLCRARHPRYTQTFDPWDYVDGVDSIQFADVEELRVKLARCEADPPAYEALLKACFEKTVAYFTAEAQVERLLSWALQH